MFIARLLLLTALLVLLTTCTGQPGDSPVVDELPAAIPSATSRPPSTPLLATPTLSITDIPGTTTPVIQTATLPPAATPLAELQTNVSPPASALADYLLLSSLPGRAVRGPEGHALGSLSGMVIARSGPSGPQIRYGLLAASPEVGLPENQNLIFVPWPLFVYNEDLAVLLLTTEPGYLAQAPAFSADGLPAAQQPGWDSALTAFWNEPALGLPITGTTPPASAGSASPTQTTNPVPIDEDGLLVRGKLANLRMNAPNGESLGMVEDFVIQAQTSELSFVLLSYDGRLIPMPMAQVRWNSTPADSDVGVLQMTLPPNLLTKAPAFATLDDFNTAPPDWHQAVTQYWLNR